jgi:hypothetical protein
MQKMTARHLREQIEAIDHELGELQPWEKKLAAMRKRYVLNDQRDVVSIIENGLRAGQGRPAISDLDPFDDGWPGLSEARETISELKERRALFVEQLPSKAETAERIKEAETRAAAIRKRAEALALRMSSVETTLNAAAHQALAVAHETSRLWEETTALDKLAAEADIARPETPHVQSPTFPAAAQLSALMRRCFSGGQHQWVKDCMSEQKSHG